jgi:hydroxymethylpyrimidine/phosphomethylpyrimidine kinase
MHARALTIAGSDSGGGAGIQADLKTFHSLGVYGMSVVTALTAQNTLGVQGIYDVPPAFIELQLRSVLSDIGADAAKTGMLSCAAAIRAVARVLREQPRARRAAPLLVVDPVMASKHGDALLRAGAIKTLVSELLPLALVVTPNIGEAELLSGLRIRSLDEMKRAARIMHERFFAEFTLSERRKSPAKRGTREGLRMTGEGFRMTECGPRFIVIKGGHLRGAEATDLVFDGARSVVLRAKRIRARHTHGTGCTFSAAIAAYLALGCPALEAIRRAKAYVTRAIRHARPLGRGIGPVCQS